MPKINVYLPDDLAEAVRVSGVPVSAVCQRALEEAVLRVAAIRAAAVGELTDEGLAARLPHFTARARSLLLLASGMARDEGISTIHTGHFLRAILDEGESLALHVLNAMNVDLDGLRADLGTVVEESTDGDGLHISGPAAVALEFAVTEATSFRHNYIGSEHILLGMVTEPDGRAGQALRARGVEPKATRRAITAALALLVQARAQASGAPTAATAGADALSKILAPLVERIERLERRLDA